ncbi:MAG: DUF4838 domain-containing protein [Kiritimatiellia bacterium]
MARCASTISTALFVCAAFGAFAVRGEADPMANRALPSVERLAAAVHEPLKLVENGELRFAIVGDFKAEAAVRGPDGQTLKECKRDSVWAAAHTLADCFQKCTGMKPAVLEADDPKAAEFPYVIAVGKTKWSEVLGMKPDEFPREGFELRTFEKGVVIAGMDGFAISGFYDLYNWRCSRLSCNGTQWGAVDFVERFLGVRRFTLKGKGLWDIMPPCRDLTLAPCAYRDHPRYQMRWRDNENWRGGVSTDFFGGEAPRPFDLAEAHPDKLETIFFRDSAGKLWQDDKVYGNNFLDCTNPELADILVEDFKQYYASSGTNSYWGTTWAPSTRYLWFGQCDKKLSFDNERARKFPRQNPEIASVASEIYGYFYDYFGRRVKEELPGKTIVFMAYSNYLMPPRSIEKLPDNVQMLVCLGTPALVKSKAYLKLIGSVYDGWARLTAPDKKPVAYTYDLSYAGAGLVPQLLRGYYEGEFLRTTAPHLSDRFVYTCNVRTVKDGDISHESFLSNYLIQRALWNPEYDAAAGIEDYFRLTCGDQAGAHLVKLFRILVDCWEKDYLPAFERGPYFKHTMVPLRTFRCIPYIEYERLNTQTLSKPVLRALAAELDAAEKALPEGETFRQRFDDFAVPFRKMLADTAAYQASFGTTTLEIGREPTRLPQLKIFSVAGGISPRGAVTECHWDDLGVHLSFRHAYNPFLNADTVEASDTYELFLAPGERPANVYRFAMTSDGRMEEWHKQVDQPRAPDIAYAAQGAVYKAEVKGRWWHGEFFVPWSALYDKPPKAGDMWKMNLVMRRHTPKLELSSIAPTIGDVWREELYATANFK